MIKKNINKEKVKKINNDLIQKMNACQYYNNISLQHS
jgi:hypothetical protein